MYWSLTIRTNKSFSIANNRKLRCQCGHKLCCIIRTIVIIKKNVNPSGINTIIVLYDQYIAKRHAITLYIIQSYLFKTTFTLSIGLIKC